MKTYQAYRDDADGGELYIEAPFQDGIQPNQEIKVELDGRTFLARVMTLGHLLGDTTQTPVYFGYSWGIAPMELSNV